MQNHYEVLGADKEATHDEIKRAYRRLARKYHPDVNQSDPEAEANFKRVQAAWEVLGDPDRRADYDADESGDMSAARTLLAFCIRQGLERAMNAGPFGVTALACTTLFVSEVRDVENRKTIEARQLLEALKLQKGRVRRSKDGANAFESVIDVEIEKAQAFIDGHNARVDEINKVQKLLREYLDGTRIGHERRALR